MKIGKRFLALGLAAAIGILSGNWEALAENDLPEYDHAWCFGESDKSRPEGASVGEEKVFTYEYGVNGSFSPLTAYRIDWSAWTLNQNAPSVGAWFMGAGSEAESAVVFTAPRAMNVELSSTLPIALDSQYADLCDGVGLMVLIQNDYGFAPLWPKAGSFTWYDVKSQGTAALSGVRTRLRTGDRLLFVVHSLGATADGDTIQITPKVAEIAEKAEYPKGFSGWVSDREPSSETGQKPSTGAGDSTAPGEVSYVSSWYLGEGGYNSNTKDNDYPFSYRYGFGGVYDNYLPLKESYDWGNVWRIPDVWAPWIAGYFLSVAKGVDGAVAFTAPETGTYEFSSTLGKSIQLDTSGGNDSDGAQFLVVSQNAEGNYYPLYPSLGKWEWLTLRKDQKYPFEPVTVSLKAGERLLFIAHSTGSDVNDTIGFDAKVVLKKAGSLAAYHSEFVPWPEGFSDPDPDQNPAKLSELFTSASPAVGPLSLQFGYDGEYQPMTLYREDWGAWTYGGNAPAIGAWFMGAVAKRDAVLIYTAPSDGKLHVKSETALSLDWGEKSDGAQVMVVLKNQNGERPLWPADGQWEWAKITNGMELPMDGISVFVRKGDQVHVIVRSVGNDEYDTVDINPVFDLDDSVTEGALLEAVERVYPTEDDYAAKLLKLSGSLDAPAGTGQQEKPGASFPIWGIIIIVIGVAFVVTVAVVSQCKREKRKSRKNEENDQGESKGKSDEGKMEKTSFITDVDGGNDPGRNNGHAGRQWFCLGGGYHQRSAVLVYR